MCGIVGLSLVAKRPSAHAVVTRMSELLVHRGPDSGGYLASSDGQAHVGFRRLAIRDLNPRANQPMVSASGRTAIVFNGEVYNSSELAARYLGGRILRTSGDTEVILEILERRGFDVLSELNGMFAIAIVHLETGRITLARDRFGKKPLYVYQDNGVVAFSSELASLKPFGLRVDPKQAELFFHFGYFPSPATFFKNTTQVCPGEAIQLRAGKIVARSRFHRFTDRPWAQDEDEVNLDALDDRLRNAVALRMRSDVPLGAFLSGGVDSALVAAHLGSQTGAPPPTFTVAFADSSHNESSAAAETASELGLPHHTIEIEEQDLANLAIEYQSCYEQPYGDTSGLATMLLCRAVKQHVTVALSGDGGDEFFGGYARYSWFRKALIAQQWPSFARQVAALGVSRLDRRRGRRLARWLTAGDPAELYAEILRNWTATDLRDLVDPSLIHASTGADYVRAIFDRTDGDALSKAACFDASYYIPDDLQVKLDRASMRVALEVRCPLLDFRIADMGLGLRTELKYRDGLKTTLKSLLKRHVSPQVLDRPKRGFRVPLARWLRGPMRELVRDTVGQQSVRESGWLDQGTMSRVWEAFVRGKSHYAHSVWMLFGVSHHLRQHQTDPLFSSLRQQPRSVRPTAA